MTQPSALSSCCCGTDKIGTAEHRNLHEMIQFPKISAVLACNCHVRLMKVYGICSLLAHQASTGIYPKSADMPLRTLSYGRTVDNLYEQ